MKRVLSASLCLLMAWLSASAAPITRTQAQQKATAFMMERGWVNQKTLSRITTPRRAASNGANSLTYVFNAPDNKGFVILSGDDRTEPVIGYAEGGSFDEATIPVNMKGWLANIEEEIQWIQDNDVQVVSVHKVPSHNAISPLLSSKWGQDAPYNGLCPSGCPTGCLATAVAQVMYYHKWPNQTLEAIPGYTTYTTHKRLNSLPVTTFDWSSMSDTYRGGTNNAVAKLMQYVGYSVQMDYTTNGSGASEKTLPSVMKKYFDYSNSTALAYRENYSIESWDQLVYSELAAGRPVVYCGQSMGGGHAFVCDGYDGNGLYHINWGWDGSYDNYFRLSVLNPGTTTAIGSSETPDGFTMFQSVLYGVKKQDGASEPNNSEISISSLSASNSSLILTASGVSGSLYLGFAVLGDNGELDIKSSGRVTASSYLQTATYRVSVSNLNLTSNGTYTVVPVFKFKESDTFQQFNLRYYYFVVTVSNGNISIETHPTINLLAENIHFKNKVTLNRMSQVDYQLLNNGDEYNGMLYLFASSTSSKGSPVAYANVACEPNETQDLSFWYIPSQLDDVTLYIATDQSGENVIGQQKMLSFELEGISYELRYNPVYISVTVKNNSEMDYNNEFVAKIFVNGSSKAGATVNKQQNIPAGGETTFVYDTFNLSQSSTYLMKFSYRKNDYSSTMVELPLQVYIDWSDLGATAISTPETVSVSTNDFYSLYGVKIAKPVINGIYIHNGKKYVK